VESINGKRRKSNRKDDDKHHKRGRGTKKNPIVGVVERNKRKVVHANLSLEGKKLPDNQLLGILNKVCN